MADESNNTNDTNSTSKVPFTNILEILANKVSRKAAVITMAMILIYMLAATPNVASTTLFTMAIVILAMFFTTLQWIIDLKDDSGDAKKKNKKSDTLSSAPAPSVYDAGKDT